MVRISNDKKQNLNVSINSTSPSRADSIPSQQEEPVVSPVGLTSKPSRRVALTRSQFFWLVLLLIIFAGISTWLGYKVWKGSDPVAIAVAEKKTLIAEVGKLFILPNEEPTVATVNDLAPLKGQAFFDHAKIGDRVLVFRIAQKAILYRPSEQKIVEVAPVNLGAEPVQAPSSEENILPSER